MYVCLFVWIGLSEAVTHFRVRFSVTGAMNRNEHTNKQKNFSVYRKIFINVGPTATNGSHIFNTKNFCWPASERAQERGIKIEKRLKRKSWITSIHFLLNVYVPVLSNICIIYALGSMFHGFFFVCVCHHGVVFRTSDWQAKHRDTHTHSLSGFTILYA